MKKFLQLIKNNSLIRLSFYYLIFLLIIGAIMLGVEGSANDRILGFFDAVWFGVVTMTTTGFGDIVPVTPLGKVFAMISVFIGVALFSALTGTLASVGINRISKLRSGFMKHKAVKDHLIICGWRERMNSFLEGLLRDGNFSTEKIVIISEPTQTEVDKLFENEKLHGIRFVRGSAHSKDVLLRANVLTARKAIVLSDQYSKTSGFDVDSRVVMAVIAIKTLNKNVYVCAQLLERDFDVYLERANCDEIVYSKDISVNVLSQTIKNDGMSNVMQELLSDKNTECKLAIEDIKPQYINKSYIELKMYYGSTHPQSLLLGVLENTGRRSEITELAIRKAQKTANFLEMISNLKHAKQLRPFCPVFIPDEEYTIVENSSAIVLKKL